MNAKNTRRLNVHLDVGEAKYVEEYAEQTYRTVQQVVQMLLSTAIAKAVTGLPPGSADRFEVAEVRPTPARMAPEPKEPGGDPHEEAEVRPIGKATGVKKKDAG